MRKSDGLRVHQKNRAMGGDFTKRKRDGVRVHQGKKSDGVRVQHEKERWGES